MTEEKTLFIVRHGKSTWDYPGISDIDRPLKDRGIQDAYDMSARILSKKLLPESIVSSPAARALHSAIIFARVLNFPLNEININKGLYEADVSDCLTVIKETDKNVNSLMIFGHNPGFTELVNVLSTMDLDNLPTTGLAILKFRTTDWQGISRKVLTEEFLDYPRNF